MNNERNRVCPYCQSVIERNERAVTCSFCQTSHHKECWDANGRCTLFGCNGTPVAETAASAASSNIAAISRNETSRPRPRKASKWRYVLLFIILAAIFYSPVMRKIPFIENQYHWISGHLISLKSSIQDALTSSKSSSVAANQPAGSSAASKQISMPWVYFIRGPWEASDLYKIKTDGSGLQKVLSGFVSDPVAADGWIYFDNTHNLYKIKPDGSSRQELCKDNPSFTNVYGDWIYYNNGHDSGRLYKIKKDGTGRKKLSNDSVLKTQIDGDWIYYLGGTDFNNRIYKIKQDGTERKKISDNIVWNDNLCLYGGWFFYSNEGDGKKLYRIKADGTKGAKLCNDVAANFVIDDYWIYYVNYSDNSKLYKIKTDGTGRQKLCDDKTGTLSVYEGMIYYTNHTGDKYNMGGDLYKIKTDGTGRQKLLGQECYDLCVLP